MSEELATLTENVRELERKVIELFQLVEILAAKANQQEKPNQ